MLNRGENECKRATAWRWAKVGAIEMDYTFTHKISPRVCIIIYLKKSLTSSVTNHTKQVDNTCGSSWWPTISSDAKLYRQSIYQITGTYSLFHHLRSNYSAVLTRVSPCYTNIFPLLHCSFMSSLDPLLGGQFEKSTENGSSLCLPGCQLLDIICLPGVRSWMNQYVQDIFVLFADKGIYFEQFIF